MSATAVHSLWTTAADPISKIDAPKIEYGQLAPTLIIVGAAVLGVLVEAFVPRKSRYYAQMFVAVVALAAAFAAVVALAADGYGTTKAGIAAMGAVAVDGPALFLQGTILLTALVGLFTFAERRLDPEAHGNRVDSSSRRPRPYRAATARRRRSGRVHHHRGVPAAALRGRRHAGLPGGQRPADAVRGAGGPLAPAVPADARWPAASG
ncbi:hypothetical protein GCM10023238_21200 [Streptomyces heliomycini]